MARATQGTGYSVENAREFGWGTGDLTTERRDLLDNHVVGKAVLDAGCGVGGFVDYLSRRGYAATGLEKHDMFLAVGREKGFLGDFVQCDLSSTLPFRDGAFDTTICLDVLEHVENDVHAVRELIRVTRKRLVVAVPQEDRWMPSYSLIFYPYRDPTHLRYYTPESLGALVTGDWAANVTITGEYPIQLQKLALDHLVPRSKWPILSPIYRTLFRILVNRTWPPTLFMNLVAIVDLRPATP